MELAIIEGARFKDTHEVNLVMLLAITMIAVPVDILSRVRGVDPDVNFKKSLAFPKRHPTYVYLHQKDWRILKLARKWDRFITFLPISEREICHIIRENGRKKRAFLRAPSSRIIWVYALIFFLFLEIR